MNLKKTFKNLPYINKNGYNYFIHPLTDGTFEMEPEHLQEFAQWVNNNYQLDADLILTAEAMGIPLATAVSLITGLPMVIARKRQYNLPGEIAIEKTTGYSKEFLYINGIQEGNKVLFIDDVYDTGGTLQAIHLGLLANNIDLVEAFVLVSKKTSPTIAIPVYSYVEIKDVMPDNCFKCDSGDIYPIYCSGDGIDDPTEWTCNSCGCTRRLK